MNDDFWTCRAAKSLGQSVLYVNQIEYVPWDLVDKNCLELRSSSHFWAETRFFVVLFLQICKYFKKGRKNMLHNKCVCISHWRFIQPHNNGWGEVVVLQSILDVWKTTPKAVNTESATLNFFLPYRNNCVYLCFLSGTIVLFICKTTSRLRRRHCGLARHFKTDPTETVALCFGYAKTLHLTMKALWPGALFQNRSY
jgi:hypothetical protein